MRLRNDASPNYSGLARSWTRRSFRGPSASQQRVINRKRVDAVERLDLRALTRAWG